MTFFNGIPEYNNVDDFKDALACLEECVDKHNNYLSGKYALLSEEEYDDLFYNGIESEFLPLEEFTSSWNVLSLFEKDEITEENWLSAGGLNLDWSTYPDNEIAPFGEEFKALLNEDCMAIINNEIVNVCSEYPNGYQEDERSRSHLCLPTYWRVADMENNSGSRRLRLRAGIGSLSSLTGGFMEGYVKSYRLRSNGRWRSTRTDLVVAAGSFVRDIGCELINNGDYVATGTKARNNRRSISVRVRNWTTGKWFHHPHSHAGNDDGVVTASNQYQSDNATW